MIKSDWVSDCLCSKLAKVSSDVLCVFGREAQALSQLQRCESSCRKADLVFFFYSVNVQRCLTPVACAAYKEARGRLLDLISVLNSCQSAAGERCVFEIDTGHFCSVKRRKTDSFLISSGFVAAV